MEVDERALREIYLPAFKAAVQDGGVWSVMGAYNQLRGQHCCDNDYLLNQILKGEWGFKGLVMSDWDGTHDTREAALNGLDLEMGTEKNYDDFYLAQPYLDLLKTGELPLAGLDEKVRRNLRVMFATHVLDAGRKTGSLNTAAHQAVARQVAEEGIVLLKNENQHAAARRREAENHCRHWRKRHAPARAWRRQLRHQGVLRNQSARRHRQARRRQV